jgi:hypothetical protein
LQIERIVTELRADGTPIRDEANRTMPAFVLPDPVEA